MVNRFRCTHGSLGFKPFLLLVTLSVRMRFGLLLLRMNLPGFVGGGVLASHLFTLVALSFRHLSLVLSRVSVFVVISVSKDWKKHVPGWLNCVPNGRQAAGLALNRILGSMLVVGLLWWMMFGCVFLRKSPQ
jgi:hypothetical protein